MFNKKAIGLLLSAALAVTSVIPTFASENVSNVDISIQNIQDTIGNFGANTYTFGTQTNGVLIVDTGFVETKDGNGSFGNGNYNMIDSDEYDFSYDYSLDNWEEYNRDGIAMLKKISFSINAKNNYTVNIPKIKVNGSYKLVGWIDALAGVDGKSVVILPAKGTFKFDESVAVPRHPEDGGYAFAPLLEYVGQSINEKFQTVSFNEGGHTVSANINVTPAYTGSKIKAGDVIESLEIDGQKISADKVKVKVDKAKAAGSTVEVKIQKIKGLDKETNKLLKGKSLGSVTIRPIVAQELLTSPTKTYSKEGQVYVKAKGDKVKAVYVYVPKKGKYSDSKKVKKIKLKKGTYTYDSSTPAVIFNSDLISGSAVAGK